MEHAACAASPLLALLGLCKLWVLADALPSIDHPRCVSAKHTCIFYRTLDPMICKRHANHEV